MNDTTNNLRGVYVLLGSLLCAAGLALTIKEGWRPVVVVLPVVGALLFLIVFFLQHAIARGGTEAARRILALVLPCLITFGIIRFVLYFLQEPPVSR